MRKRILSLTLALCVLFGCLPVRAEAQGCPHHSVHTDACGYRPEITGSPCTHAHGEACWTVSRACVHACSESCTHGGDGLCTSHVCTEEEGCIQKTLTCAHTHDSGCGYVPAQAGIACSYDPDKCPECGKAEPAEEIKKAKTADTTPEPPITEGEGLSAATLSVPFGTRRSGLIFHVAAEDGAEITYNWYRKGEDAPLNSGVEADVSGLKTGSYELYCVAKSGETSITSAICAVTVTKADTAFTARLSSDSIDWGGEIALSLSALTPGGAGLQERLEVYLGEYTGKTGDKRIQNLRWKDCGEGTLTFTDAADLIPCETLYTLTLRYPGDDDRNPSTQTVTVTITPCLHRSADSEGKCAVCKTQMATSLELGGETRWYPTLSEGVKDAAEGTQTNPAVLVLWQDVPEGLTLQKGVIRLDLNGCTVTDLKVADGADVTAEGGTIEDAQVSTNASLTNDGATIRGSAGVLVRDGGCYVQEDGSVTGTAYAIGNSGGSVTIRGGRVEAGGMIAFQCGSGSLEVSGGTIVTRSDTFYGEFSQGLPTIRGGTFLGGIRATAYPSGTVLLGDMLAEGYALKTAEGWPDLSGKNSLSDDCTAAAVPLTITRQPENVFVPEGGDTGTLTVAAEASHVLSYQWYRLDGDRERLLEGETAPELTVSAADGGISQYYFCVVTADGYALRTKKAAITAAPAVLTIDDALLEGVAGTDGWIREDIRLVPPAVAGREVLISLPGTEDWRAALSGEQLPQGEYDLEYVLACGVNGAAQLPYARKTIRIRHDSEKPQVEASCASGDITKRGAVVTTRIEDGEKGSGILSKVWTETGGKAFTATWGENGEAVFTELQPGTAYRFLLTVTDRAGNSTKQEVTLTTREDPLANAHLTVEGEYTYSGLPQSPQITVTRQGQTLAEGDYTLWYSTDETRWTDSAPVDAGTYRLLLTVPGQTPEGDETAHGSYTIATKALEPEILWNGGNTVTKIYDGTTQVPDGLFIHLKGAVGSEMPTAQASQWAYNSPNVREAVRITASGIMLTRDAVSRNYTLSQTHGQIDAAITQSTPTLAFAPGFAPDRPYNGRKLENPGAGDLTLTGAVCADVGFQWADEQETPLTEAPVDAGYYYLKAYIPETANTRAVQTELLAVRITPKAVTPVVTVVETAIYNGEPQTPAVEVRDGDHLIPAGEYTVTYFGNVEAGTNSARVKITDRDGGNYQIRETSVPFSILRDRTAPVLRGIEDGGKYYGETLFTVEEENLLSVTVDGRRTTSYRIAPDNKSHTITATDKGGNVTTVTIQVYKTYEVVYKADGREVDRQTVNHGADAVAPAVPARPGYKGQWEHDGKNITANRIINAGYQRTGQVLTTPVELLGEPDEYILILTEGVQVTGDLGSLPNRDTRTEIRESLFRKLSAKDAAIKEERTRYYDVTLWVSTDDGQTWTPVDDSDLPEKGITVILPYPSGTDRRRYDFTVAHMIDTGTDVGKTEFPEIKKTGDGIRFTLTGLSPVAVSWVNSSLNNLWESLMSSMTGNPQTGDPFRMELWVSTMAISGTGLLGLAFTAVSRRKKK